MFADIVSSIAVWYGGYIRRLLCRWFFLIFRLLILRVLSSLWRIRRGGQERDSQRSRIRMHAPLIMPFDLVFIFTAFFVFLAVFVLTSAH